MDADQFRHYVHDATAVIFAVSLLLIALRKLAVVVTRIFRRVAAEITFKKDSGGILWG
jgi:hypothetical protein